MMILGLVLAAITVVGIGLSIMDSQKMMRRMSVKPPEYDSIKVPVAEEGREIPIVFGTVDLMGPNICWNSRVKFKRIRKKGGKK